MIEIDHAKLCVRKGWHPLLDILYAAKPDDVTVTQVKEKYGGLCFYLDAAPMPYHDLVDAVEKLSYQICEDCGKVGRAREKGWIRTLCDRCDEKRR